MSEKENLLTPIDAASIAPMWSTTAERLTEADEAYLLDTDDAAGKITVLALVGDTWRIFEDRWDAPTAFHETIISAAGVKVIAELARQKFAVREPVGRPPLYSVDNEGNDIFMRQVYGGETIRGIAKDKRMSPSTVQKLLNEAKMQTAQKLFSGELPLLKDSPYWTKNIALLRWAVKRMHGKERADYEKFVNAAVKF